MRETADVVVIGGGSTGSSVAWHLARAGLTVRLLERGTIASGSSGDSPGIVRQYYPNPALARLAARGLRIYRQWAEMFDGECGYQRTGFLTGVTQAEWGRTCVQVHQQQSDGIGVALYSPTQMRALIADLQVDGLAGAVYEQDAGYCDARATAQSFAQGAQRFGAVIDEHRTACRIHTLNGRVTGVETDRGRIDAAVLVNAAGPWAASLAATCGADLPITASRQGVAICRIEAQAEEAQLPGYSERKHGFYLRPDSPGIYMIGSLAPDDSGPVDPDAHRPQMGGDVSRRYCERAAQRFSRLSDASPVGSRVSFFDDTPDGNPIVGVDPRVDGLIVAAGLSGHGFKFAPVFGQEIAALIAGGKMHADLDQFEVSRFLD
ncbi:MULTISPECIES: NAD(P)/FAD-dependent oxidoreductase [Burkholderiaceae]|jgi:sarcosine oxidase subunit beta|uniref:FAD dependent oxidoreductase n=2 Tax=Burkholderiaceae TaxID=119060 RepID=B2T0Z1_PARPJ|nr:MULTISPECIES: FAD-binding oxidoreductase [Burkholderiaceae]MDP9546015.1 glycine/D-amino acid oxidase-like deaminating enzyme [Burkholderia cepacia]UTP22427.1 FAD-binding oxidoreductase [Burkholderia sp. FXe9]HEP6275804.1 FAD-binding oxidoreductase [Burkholderia vietnamiensis]ACD14711.1 FAD dependent oxidoreductase [Paraburkholderia phytofirmans PsJN]MBR8391247.1 FAD-binding oxidoreductase [Burkholderia cenocepacia]